MENVYYHPEKFDLELLAFDEPDMSFEYNTLCFWATKDGLIYTASDIGCSCPTPFEKYDSENQKEVLQKLERIGSVEQALSTFDSWNKAYDNKTHLGIESRKELEQFVSSRLIV